MADAGAIGGNRAVTMSSLQIAEITGKEHRNVMRDIRETLDQAEIDPLKFEHIYRDALNREQRCFHLPRRECDLVVSGYSVKYRLAIIDRWQFSQSFAERRPGLGAASPSSFGAARFSPAFASIQYAAASRCQPFGSIVPSRQA